MAKVTVIVVNKRNPNEKLPFIGVTLGTSTLLTDANGRATFDNVTLPIELRIRAPMMSPITEKVTTEGEYIARLQPAIGF